jgi:hypothetical protein
VCVAPEAQAIFFRRRHQPRRPLLEIMPQKKKPYSTAGLGLKGIQTHGTKLQTYLCQLNAAFL